MPKLWNDTIEAHRREVREAILDATARLVAEHGLRPVTMSQIAEAAGIGRATLYRYYADLDAVLLAWHERQVTAHLEHLAQVRDRADGATDRLEAVLGAYARISRGSHRHGDADLVAFLHRDEQAIAARRQLHAMISDLVTEGATTGDLRDDVPPDELANYCLHALTAANDLRSEAAVRRLVAVTLTALRPSSKQ